MINKTDKNDFIFTFIGLCSYDYVKVFANETVVNYWTI